MKETRKRKWRQLIAISLFFCRTPPNLLIPASKKTHSNSLFIRTPHTASPHRLPVENHAPTRLKYTHPFPIKICVSLAPPSALSPLFISIYVRISTPKPQSLVEAVVGNQLSHDIRLGQGRRVPEFLFFHFYVFVLVLFHQVPTLLVYTHLTPTPTPRIHTYIPRS